MKLCSTLAGMALAVHAGSAFPQTSIATYTDPIVVTATRTARTADETLASITVITREEIERSQANDVAELLRGILGVNITRAGGYGTASSVFLRGTNPGHVLVLVDGIKIGSATTGAPTWEFLPLAEIERIEIVRGPRSSLYGSEAIGGVVQLFTRRGEGPVRPDATVMAGSFHTHEASVGVSGGPGNGWFSLHAGEFATRGINATRRSNPVFEPDRDAYDNTYGSIRTGYRLAPGTEVELYAWRATGNTEFDSPGFSDETDFRQNLGAVRLQSRVTPTWTTRLQAGVSEDKTFNFRADGAATPSRFDTQRRIRAWQNDFSLSDRALLTLGYDQQEDRVTSTANLLKNSRDNHAWFGVYQAELASHSLQASLRRDDNEQFGRHDTGSLAYGYALSPRYRLYASYGTAFRAPTFVDLYWPDPVFSTGNPNLRPEESRSVELGLAGRSAPLHWTLNLFHTRIENLIVLTGPTFLPDNLSQAAVDGVELGAATTVDPWHVAANVTLLDPRNTDSGKYLQRRSRQAARLDVDRQLGKARLGATLLAEGARYDDPANQVRLTGYALLNLRAEWTLSRDWRLAARAENILDKDYETVAGYNTLGRSVFVSVLYRPTAK